jgi:coenzyme F420-reducing hydrogenase alpha subunit
MNPTAKPVSKKSKEATPKAKKAEPKTHTIKIAPVTRVEGHGAITIQLDAKGEVANAHFHVMDFRAFERFMTNRPVEEAVHIAPRMCGICPVSHHLAAAKAGDALYNVDPPRPAKLLRELEHCGQILHSHVLHFFYLAAPDLLLPNADASTRNVVTLLKNDPKLVKQVIRLRQIGQNIIEAVGGRAIHPVTAIPGGQNKPLSATERGTLLKEVDEAKTLATTLIPAVRPVLGKVELVDRQDTAYLGLVKQGNLELYDGSLRLVGHDGKRLEEFAAKDYLKYIGEHVEDYSYLKFPFYRKLGWPKGIYRVGPLGRINVCDTVSTPLAREELQRIRDQFGRTPDHNHLYHWARMVEILYAVERAEQLLNDKDITNPNTRTNFEVKAGEGVGVIEAPRGTLIHDYTANDKGILTNVNLIVATVGNNPSMDIGVKNMAQRTIRNGRFNEAILNSIEQVVRCFDPCLSCAVHTVNGHMALRVELVDQLGRVVKVLQTPGA